MSQFEACAGQKWAALRFGEVKVETDGEQHIPHRDGVAVPLEDARILWQR